ncbi:MAG: hypothetical protein HY611_02095 [Elusimicrobia bacterium]|nr:hypothetical protein [Elusimicrobiota bacterium]
MRKLGLHKGAAIAVTLNERLDYFGQSINIAARVQNLAAAEEIYFTRSIHDYPGVRELLKDLAVSPGTAQLTGLQQEIEVYKVAGAPSLAAPAR